MPIHSPHKIIDNCKDKHKNPSDVNNNIISIFLALFVSEGVSKVLLKDNSYIDGIHAISNKLQNTEENHETNCMNMKDQILQSGGKGIKRLRLYGGDDANEKLKNEIKYTNVQNVESIKNEF